MNQNKRSTVDAGLGSEARNGGKVAKIDPEADLATGERLSEEVGSQAHKTEIPEPKLPAA